MGYCLESLPALDGGGGTAKNKWYRDLGRLVVHAAAKDRRHSTPSRRRFYGVVSRPDSAGRND